jgi:hypothetical protein
LDKATSNEINRLLILLFLYFYARSENADKPPWDSPYCHL